ncbi:MCE family protein [Nocardioides mangrovi]|uniref:MCE family protein n=1 Tax=Nocardioides mangrovi TaxID=2874580 RepID=A0ABS7UCQ9_9ACTN|nr:MCE family protein [Nocardioides mangrovi]MBZ5738784.1 MCE family protein [Nocardioides mangrovi]
MTARLARWVALLTGLVLLSAGCKFDGAYDLPLPGSPVDAGNSYEVTAEFHDILNVVPKSPVMVDDVTVGEVTDVERIGWNAKITMRIKDDVDLPANAIADIRQVSLLGEKYVALEPPSDGSAEGKLADGDNIPLSATGRNPEVEEVLGALSFLLSGGGVGQLGTITHELNEVMDGRTDRLRHLLANLDSVVGTIDDQKDDIVNAMDSLNHLTSTLNKEKDNITGALDVAGPAVQVLAAQHDELIAMLTSLQRLGAVGTRVIGQSKDDILASLDHLQPILQQLYNAGDKLAPGLNLLVSFPFPKEASEVVKGDYANTSIRADINLENLLPAGSSGGGIPGVDPGKTVNQVLKCLRSGELTSKACQKVLNSLNLVKKLRKACKKDKYADNPVCTIINTLPGAGGLLDGVGGALGGLLDGLGDALTSGTASSKPSADSLFGGGQ